MYMYIYSSVGWFVPDACVDVLLTRVAVWDNFYFQRWNNYWSCMGRFGLD